MEASSILCLNIKSEENCISLPFLRFLSVRWFILYRDCIDAPRLILNNEREGHIAGDDFASSAEIIRLHQRRTIV